MYIDIFTYYRKLLLSQCNQLQGWSSNLVHYLLRTRVGLINTEFGHMGGPLNSLMLPCDISYYSGPVWLFQLTLAAQLDATRQNSVSRLEVKWKKNLWKISRKQTVLRIYVADDVDIWCEQVKSATIERSHAQWERLDKLLEQTYRRRTFINPKPTHLHWVTFTCTIISLYKRYGVLFRCGRYAVLLPQTSNRNQNNWRFTV